MRHSNFERTYLLTICQTMMVPSEVESRLAITGVGVEKVGAVLGVWGFEPRS